MDEFLEKGVVAYKTGKIDEARNYFSKALDQNRDDERVWGWIFNVAKNDKERIYCLEQMLRINPNNSKAKDLLMEIQKKYPPVENINKGSVDLNPPLPSVPQVNSISQDVPKQEKKKGKNLLTAGIVVLLFLFACCLFLSFSSYADKSGLIPSSNPSNPSSSNSGSQKTITYVGKGNVRIASITYTNETGGDNSGDYNLPFKKQITVTDDGMLFLHVSPSFQSNSYTGTFTCEIYRNGILVDTQTSTNNSAVCTTFLK